MRTISGRTFRSIRTHPQHWLDLVGLRYALRALGFRKDSRGWDWRRVSDVRGFHALTKGYKLLVVKDVKAGRRRGFVTTLINTNLWPVAAVLSVDNNGRQYRIGFSADEDRGPQTMWCSIALTDTEVAVGVGPYDTTFFAQAIDGSGEYFKIRCVDRLQKRYLRDDLILL